MNKKQKICLWVGLTLIAALAIYPPYKIDLLVKMNLGHRFFLNPIGFDFNFHEAKLKASDCVKLDMLRLIIEWLLIGAITAGGIWAFKNKKQKTSKNNK